MINFFKFEPTDIGPERLSGGTKEQPGYKSSRWTSVEAGAESEREGALAFSFTEPAAEAAHLFPQTLLFGPILRAAQLCVHVCGVVDLARGKRRAIKSLSPLEGSLAALS